MAIGVSLSFLAGARFFGIPRAEFTGSERTAAASYFAPLDLFAVFTGRVSTVKLFAVCLCVGLFSVCTLALFFERCLLAVLYFIHVNDCGEKKKKSFDVVGAILFVFFVYCFYELSSYDGFCHFYKARLLAALGFHRSFSSLMAFFFDVYIVYIDCLPDTLALLFIITPLDSAESHPMQHCKVYRLSIVKII